LVPVELGIAHRTPDKEILMTQIATNPGADIRPVARTSRVRPWIALAAAAVVLALGLLGVLLFMLVLPVIGVVLALGAPPDHVIHARSIARRPRNAVLGVVLAAALAVVILHPDLSLPLVTLFGLDGSGLAVIVLAVVALALPLAMTDAPTDTRPDGFLLTRRNLILSLTVLVVVADWYAGRGLSLLPIGVLVLTLPLIIGFSRLVAARRQRIEYDLLRRPLRAELGPHRLQLANVTLLCALLALTLLTGAYDPVALQLTPGLHRVLLTAFWVGLAAFVLLSLIPLRRVRLGSNLLVAAATIFLAVQLISVYGPPVDAVTVGTPLAGEWWVGHGGHAELVDYHQTRSTQRDALDIMQVVDGSIHRPGRTDLTSYYIYDQPVLAPADGTVTYVVDGHPDLPIGLVDSQHPTGNQLVIDIGGHYLLMGHLRQGSIIVNVGERVTEGQQIARVGKSGHSSHPHIHIQAQTLPTGIADLTTIDGPKMLKTLHTYPLLFRRASLIRGGAETRPTAVDPRRGDFVRPTR
jgi:peptidase M23-like protein